MNGTKIKCIQYCISEIEGQIRDAEIAAQRAQSDANGHVGAMASRYDTFKEEAQYISAAQLLRAGELRQLLQMTRLLYEELQSSPMQFSTVRVGSLVTLSADNTEEMSFLILFYGNGKKILCEGVPATVIGVNSPIAKSILGLCEGDDAEIMLNRNLLSLEVVRII